MQVDRHTATQSENYTLFAVADLLKIINFNWQLPFQMEYEELKNIYRNVNVVQMTSTMHFKNHYKTYIIFSI